MDKRLQERLTIWHNWIDKLSVSEKTFLSLESQEDAMYSALFLKAPGKGVAEKEAHAYSHPDWREFQDGLVEAKVQYNRDKRELELKQAAFNAEYLESKTSNEAIKRMPRELT